MDNQGEVTYVNATNFEHFFTEGGILSKKELSKKPELPIL
jgi:hypothetical protein